jgi:Sec-independent protein translocase protein TatA
MSLGSITIATLLLLAVVAVIVFGRRKGPGPVPA